MLQDVRWAGLASAHSEFLTSPHRALTRALIPGTLPSLLISHQQSHSKASSSGSAFFLPYPLYFIPFYAAGVWGNPSLSCTWGCSEDRAKRTSTWGWRKASPPTWNCCSMNSGRCNCSSECQRQHSG